MVKEEIKIALKKMGAAKKSKVKSYKDYLSDAAKKDTDFAYHRNEKTKIGK